MQETSLLSAQRDCLGEGDTDAEKRVPLRSAVIRFSLCNWHIFTKRNCTGQRRCQTNTCCVWKSNTTTGVTVVSHLKINIECHLRIRNTVLTCKLTFRQEVESSAHWQEKCSGTLVFRTFFSLTSVRLSWPFWQRARTERKCVWSVG